ncbi:hypothetical protein LDENG_00273730 [Lucifuga dentata]|nr:hypothetical protein LDENG_00273730 [Lucifuga dentata]
MGNEYDLSLSCSLKMRLPLPRIEQALPPLIATHSLYIKNQLHSEQSKADALCRLTCHRNSVTRSQADTIERQCITPEPYILFMVCVHITHQAKCTVPVSVLMLNWAKINDINK